MEPVPPGDENLEILYLLVLELDDGSALPADEMIVMRGQVAFVPPCSLPEIELFRVSKPLEQFQRPVHRDGADPRRALPDGAGEVLDRYMIPCAEETLDDDRPAPASLAPGGKDLPVDPFEESFQGMGRPSLLILNFIFILSFAPGSVKAILRETDRRPK